MAADTELVEKVVAIRTGVEWLDVKTNYKSLKSSLRINA